MIIQELAKQQIIHPPEHLPDNIIYLTIMGSEAYGVSSDSSDIDLYGICIPPKEEIFPTDEIIGFGRPKQRFEQWQKHHIKDPKTKGKTYDFTVYNITKYFTLLMENNPNIVDSIFTPQRCIQYATKISTMIRENRKLFLHKGALNKFVGYSHSQLHKVNTKIPIGKRKRTIEEYGYDVKFSYHAVRLLNEIEQILIEGDIDLERNKEQLISIRKGEWTREQVEKYVQDKGKELETIYENSKLRLEPDVKAIKGLLLNCLEEHYGCLVRARN